MKTLSVIHSLFSSESVAELIMDEYPFSRLDECRLLSMGESDYYKIKAGSHQYVLRISKADKERGSENYLFEIDWLRYLKEKRCSVSYPIQRKDGGFLGSVEVPEGLRYYVLFNFVEGEKAPIDKKRAFLLGRELARIHLISNKFQTVHKRPLLDLHFLLEKPVLVIKKHLGADFSEEQERLDGLATELKEKILSLLSFKNSNDWGVIAGDVHGFNQHFLGNQPTLFDFDLCGYGWRVYDLAVFRWLQVSDLAFGDHSWNAFVKGRLYQWKHFLSGYRSVRRLTEAEQKAIPLLVQVRQIWFMGSRVAAQNPFLSLDESWWKGNFYRLFKKFQ